MDQNMPTHSSFDLKKVAPFIITGIILLGGVVFALLKINNGSGQYQFPSITSQEPTIEIPEYVAQEGDSLLFSYTPSANGKGIDLFIEPQQPIENLITFGLDLELVSKDTKATESQYKVALDESFSQEGWSLIVNNISVEDSVRIQLAGIRSDAKPFAISEKVHIATLTLPTSIDAQGVHVSVAPKLSEAFDKQMTVYKIINAPENAEL